MWLLHVNLVAWNRTADASLSGLRAFLQGLRPRALARMGQSEHALTRAQQTESIELVVARDGIEPPTPAFSGLRSTD